MSSKNKTPRQPKSSAKLPKNAPTIILINPQLGENIGEKLGYGSAIKKTKHHFGAERFGKKIGAFFLNMNK